MSSPFAFNASIFDNDYEGHYRAQLSKCREAFEALKEPIGNPTIDNTLIPFDNLKRELNNISKHSWPLRNLIADPELRSIGEASLQAVDSLGTEVDLSPEIFARLQGIDAGSVQDKKARRALGLYLGDFKDAGAHLPKQERAKLKELQDKITELHQTFLRNINDGAKTMAFHEADLRGCPEDFLTLDQHKPDEQTGMVNITTKTTDVIPILQNAESSDVRRKVYHEWRTIAPANEDVLKSMLETSQAVADVRGYENYAEISFKNGIVKTPEEARAFISGLSIKLKPAADAELAKGAALIGVPLDELLPADLPYLKTSLVKDAFGGFDPASVRPYFLFSNVLRGILALYSEILGIEFREKEKGSVAVWHKSVRVYDIYDTSQGEERRLLGRLYMDLHPRDLKYTHACCCGISAASPGENLPEAVLVCNVPGGDGALSHQDFITMLHEAGHVCHHIFGYNAGAKDFARLSAFQMELDFIECPSQLYEQFGRQVDVLSRFGIAKNAEGDAMPAEMAASLIDSEKIGRAASARLKLFYAHLSLGLFTMPLPKGNTQDLFREIYKSWNPVSKFDETSLQHSFGHLAGYDARYASYDISLSMSLDLSQVFKANGWLNRDTGLRFRRQVLEAAGSEPAALLMEKFLGRPTNQEAYLKWLEGEL